MRPDRKMGPGRGEGEPSGRRPHLILYSKCLGNGAVSVPKYIQRTSICRNLLYGLDGHGLWLDFLLLDVSPHL